MEELTEHEDEVISKMHADKAGYRKALEIITTKIKFVKREAYTRYLSEAHGIIGEFDEDDVAYIAVALAIKADGVWSYDPHFKQQESVKLFSTGELFRFIKKSGN